ncbi:MAG: tetratricopeptide repeat protein [Hyphomicrobiaceae bacterium]|nr:tetratricopeptide repeat protein [Hyphomicrobiaceae bacterium]
MANNEDTLFREVEEELRRERMQDLWNRYGTYFLVAAVALVVGVWGARFYQERKAATAAAAGAEFEKAIALVEKSKTAEAIAAFSEIAKSGPAGYAALARLQLASTYAKSGDKAKAMEALEALAASSSADPTLKSLASLQLATMKVGDGAFTEVENRLNDLAADTSPWKASARELIAVAALKAGKVDTARAALEQVLADPAAPAGVRNRVQVLLSGIVAKDMAAAPPAAPAAEKK